MSDLDSYGCALIGYLKTNPKCAVYASDKYIANFITIDDMDLWMTTDGPPGDEDRQTVIQNPRSRYFIRSCDIDIVKAWPEFEDADPSIVD